MFHVEHEYRALWRRFQKALKQRNQLLRHGRMDEDSLRVWTAELVPLAEQVTQYRRRYLAELVSDVRDLASVFEGLGELELGYYQGWADQLGLADVFEADQS